jgi:hypothetical protein
MYKQEYIDCVIFLVQVVLFFTVSSLQDLCRGVIRRTVDEDNVHSLPLPTKIQECIHNDDTAECRELEEEKEVRGQQEEDEEEVKEENGETKEEDEKVKEEGVKEEGKVWWWLCLVVVIVAILIVLVVY